MTVSVSPLSDERAFLALEVVFLPLTALGEDAFLAVLPTTVKEKGQKLLVRTFQGTNKRQ